MKAKLGAGKKWDRYTGLLYISPWIIGFLIFTLYPFMASIYYSFTDYNMISKPSFIGLDNFKQIFTRDYDFRQSLKVTLLYVVMAVPLRLIFAMMIALLLNRKLKYMNFFRTVYYLPSILGGSVAIAILWRFLFMKEGVVNSLLGKIGISPIQWLGDPKIALFTLGLLAVWQFGSSMVIFLAGLKQVPTELYEVAKVDGASTTRIFFSITLPFLTPVILFNLVMQTVNAFQEFTGAFVVTNGGPMKSTYLYAMKLYDEAFVFNKMGYASALSWILFVIVLGLTLLIFRTSNSWVHYEDGGDKR